MSTLLFYCWEDVLQECGSLVEGVWQRIIIDAIWGSIYLGINASNYFLYWMGGACVLPPHPSELLHLNQAGVQDLISNLTYARHKSGTI